MSSNQPPGAGPVPLGPPPPPFGAGSLPGKQNSYGGFVNRPQGPPAFAPPGSQGPPPGAPIPPQGPIPAPQGPRMPQGFVARPGFSPPPPWMASPSATNLPGSIPAPPQGSNLPPPPPPGMNLPRPPTGFSQQPASSLPQGFSHQQVPSSFPQGFSQQVPPPYPSAPVQQMREMSIGGQVGPPAPQYMPRPSWQPPSYPPVPGMEQPSSPAGPPSAKIDPSQIPRPHSSYLIASYDTMSGTIPPPATSNFIVNDTGNCSPRIMRSTIYQVPCSGDLLATTGMPLAVIVQPLACPHPAEEPIKVVDFGESGPVRCSRCKAYVNPFVKFVDQGRRFICNLCQHSNETPRDYLCNLGPDGRRRDADERPELSRGTVEFVATKEYTVRPPMPPVFFFLIDVSANALRVGATAASCSAIQKVLSEHLVKGPRTLVGLATFDSSIHFYNLSPSLQQPAMLVVPDIQDVYTPLENGLLVPVSEGLEHIETLLGNIPSMFLDNPVQESAFGAAVKGAYLALKPTGGKVLVFQSVLPTVGVGALTPRDADGRPTEKDAHKVLQPADKTLGVMAASFAESQVCVDLFLTTQAYVDVASLAVVPKTTGGQLYYYFPFSATMDSAKLYSDLRWNVTRPQGWEAVMRVRCSQGLRVQEYTGNYCRRVADDVDLPAIDSDKAILVTFKHEEKFQEGALCCFQSALLYTTMDGQRRVRVSTLCLPCSNIMGNLFKGADLDAQFTYMLKHAAQTVTTPLSTQAKDQIMHQCVQSLYAYRKYCATASSSGQLILPEGLKLLPLYTLALTKSIVVQDARSDEKSYWLSRVSYISASLATALVYPRMFSVHNLSAQSLENEGLPASLPLSSEKLDPEGIFLLETGDNAFLYAGVSVSPELLYQLFEIRSVNEVVPGQFLLQEYDNEPSRLLNRLVNTIRKQRCSYLRLHLLKRGDPSESAFLKLLVEDRSHTGASYVEFLVSVHKQIQQKMQSSN